MCKCVTPPSDYRNQLFSLSSGYFVLIPYCILSQRPELTKPDLCVVPVALGAVRWFGCFSTKDRGRCCPLTVTHPDPDPAHGGVYSGGCQTGPASKTPKVQLQTKTNQKQRIKSTSKQHERN